MSINVYQIVTDRIIAQLEKGVVPWRKPWTGTMDGAFNRISKKPYSVLNQMLLTKKGEYATFKQWGDLGGKVRKGAKSEIVVFWKIQEYTETNENGEKVKKTVPLLRYYNVFHIDDVEGVKPLNGKEKVSVNPIEEGEKIKETYKLRENISIIERLGDRAFYSPARDYIEVPKMEQYTNINEYYSTLFHEMVHSTGHAKRLNRLNTGKNTGFGSEEYSKEELVAEIGSCMLCNTAGIETRETFQNSASYIASWLKVLKDDNKLIVSASGKAEKAVNYILNGAN